MKQIFFSKNAKHALITILYWTNKLGKCLSAPTKNYLKYLYMKRKVSIRHVKTIDWRVRAHQPDRLLFSKQDYEHIDLGSKMLTKQ